MQSLIGKQLRTLYDSVLVEPIPDKFVELLMKLDDVSAGLDARADDSSDTPAQTRRSPHGDDRGPHGK